MITLLTKTVLLASLGLATTVNADPESAKLEPLSGIAFEENAVAVRVMSNGCTKPEHFVVRVTQNSEGKNLLRVIRTKPDRCRRRAEAVKLVLPLKQETLQEAHVLNPFQPVRF